MDSNISHHESEFDKNKQLAELISKKKKLEFMAHHFDLNDFPPSDQLLQELFKEFNLSGDDPFLITNKILVALDQTLESIDSLSPTK